MADDILMVNQGYGEENNGRFQAGRRIPVHITRSVTMATIMPSGEKLRQAVKWISCERQENESKVLAVLIQEAALQFNLSPRDEEFLHAFYGDGAGKEGSI